MHRASTTHFPSIPCCVIGCVNGESNQGTKISQLILSSFKNGTMINPNVDSQYMNVISNAILAICKARSIPSASRTPEQKKLAEQFTLHKSGGEFDKTFPKVKQAFMQKRARRFSNGMGAKHKNTDEIIVFWQPATDEIYLYVVVEQKDTLEEEGIVIGSAESDE